MGVPSHPRKRAKNRKGQKKQTSPSRSAQGGASKEVSFPKLEPPSADYFRQAHETLKSGFDSDEEKGEFLWGKQEGRTQKVLSYYVHIGD